MNGPTPNCLFSPLSYVYFAPPCRSFSFLFPFRYDIIEGFATVDSGNLCTGDSPKARCSGNNVEIIAGSFSHNTTVRIEVKFITVCDLSFAFPFYFLLSSF